MNYSIGYSIAIMTLISLSTACMQNLPVTLSLNELLYRPIEKSACTKTSETTPLMDPHPSSALANLFLILNQPKETTLIDKTTNQTIARMQGNEISIQVIEYFIGEHGEKLVIESEAHLCVPEAYKGFHYNQAQISFLWELIKLNIMTQEQSSKSVLQKLLRNNTLR